MNRRRFLAAAGAGAAALLAGCSRGGDGVTTQRLMEAAPTIPHREFAKIADSVARFPESDFDASRITAPTLVMHGEHVPAVLRAMHEELAAQLGNAAVETTVVPDAGHASNVDNPEFFSAALREFLDWRARPP